MKVMDTRDHRDGKIMRTRRKKRECHPITGLLRRHLRIGLGGMMLAIILLGVWLGYRVSKAKAQARALAAVKAAGGWVHYADEFVMVPPLNVPRNDIRKPSWGRLTASKGPTASERLRHWIGDQYFREIVHVSTLVDIPKGKFTVPGPDGLPLDDMLRALKSQKGIRTLQINGNTLTEDGLASIAGWTELRELYIEWGSGVTDAGVARIGRLPSLQRVEIISSELTDKGIECLAGLPALEELTLDGKSFTDSSLMHLARTKHLKRLVLRSNRADFTDMGLAHLAGLKNLSVLAITGRKLTSEGKAKLIQAIPGLLIWDTRGGQM